MYNLSRIPLPNSDAFSVTAENALHLTLLIDDFIYSVDVFAPPASEGAVPEPLSAAEIEKRFAAASEDVRNRRAKGEEAPKIGLLTADERDTWVKVSASRRAI